MSLSLKERLIESIASDLGLAFDDSTESREIAYLAYLKGQDIPDDEYADECEKSRKVLSDWATEYYGQ